MANWKRVLLSGSHFTVAELQIEEIGNAASSDTILFAGSASLAGSGSFKTLSSLALDGTTTLDFTGGTFSGSFSGNGSNLTNITATADKGIKEGAGIYVLNNINGNSSSPFNGGTASNLAIKLKGSSPGTGYANSDLATNSQNDINTMNSNVDGGVIYRLGSTPVARIGLDSGSLAGLGLEWQEDFSILKLKRSTGILGGTTTFDLDSSGLKIADAFAGNGLELINGVLRVDVTNGFENSSTIPTQGNKLSLNAGVAGTGLTFNAANDRSVINIEPASVVTSSNDITIRGRGPAVSSWAGTNNSIAGSSTGIFGVIGIQESGLSTSYYTNRTEEYIDNPLYTFHLNQTWGVDTYTAGGDVDFSGDVTIQGNLTIISSSNVTNIGAATFETSDQFILLNSGSTDVSDAFQHNQGGIIVGTGGTSGSAVFYASGSTQRLFGVTNPNDPSGLIEWDDISITTTGAPGTHIQAISLVYTASHNDPINNDPAFADTEKFGSWYIEGDREPAGGESNVWIYTDDFDGGGGGGGD